MTTKMAEELREAGVAPTERDRTTRPTWFICSIEICNTARDKNNDPIAYGQVNNYYRIEEENDLAGPMNGTISPEVGAEVFIAPSDMKRFVAKGRTLDDLVPGSTLKIAVRHQTGYQQDWVSCWYYGIEKLAERPTPVTIAEARSTSTQSELEEEAKATFVRWARWNPDMSDSECVALHTAIIEDFRKGVTTTKVINDIKSMSARVDRIEALARGKYMTKAKMSEAADRLAGLDLKELAKSLAV